MCRNSVRNSLIIFIALITSSLQAQKQNNVWYFGDGNGIDFNTNPPTALNDGALNTPHGSASISDTSGQLLFYTDGETVWNRLHKAMPNGKGLLGSTNAPQTALILRKPGSANLYYIFTAPFDFTLGLHYSVVDITANNGFGDVIEKNTQLLSESVAEKVTATYDGTGCGYWVLTHGGGSNVFYAYHFTISGIDTTPVKTYVGYSYYSGSADKRGYLKVSPNGKQVADFMHSTGVQLLNFDKFSGKFSNYRLIESGHAFYYGGSFSPNSKLLYVGYLLSKEVYQFDVTLTSEAAIRASKFRVFNGAQTFSSAGAFQIAPNGKIYMAKGYNSYLAVINKPDVRGMGCDYRDTGIRVPLPFPPLTRLGLPGMIDHVDPLFSGTFLGDDKEMCLGDTISLGPDQNIDARYLWSTGDTSRKIVAKQKGLYWLKVEKVCGIDTVNVRDTIEIIEVADTSKLNLGNDTAACSDTVTLSATQIPNVLYYWSNGTNQPYAHIVKSAKYFLQTTSVCGIKKDTVQVTLVNDSVPDIHIGSDTTLCANSYLLKADTVKLDYLSYLWSTGDTTHTIAPTTSGNYWLQISNPCNVKKDTALITLVKDTVPVFSIGRDTLLCGTSYNLAAPIINNAKYIWSTGDTIPSITITQNSSPWVEVSTLCNSIADTAIVSFYKDTAMLSLGADTIVCDNRLPLQVPVIPLAKYIWNNGDTINTTTINQSGKYWIQAETPCSVKTDTIQVTLITDTLKPINLGADTVLCEISYTITSGTQQQADYIWNTGDTTPQITVTQGGIYTLTINNPCYSKTDGVNITLVQDSITSIQLGNDTLLCDNELELQLPLINGAKYQWSTGDTTNNFKATQSGIYTAQLTTPVCNNTYSDDIKITFYTPKPLQLSNDTTICQNDFSKVTLQVNNDYISYLWNTGGNTPILDVNEEGQYIISATDTCGNTYTQSATVTLCDCNLYVPSTFTPNSDGKNDRFGVVNYCGFSIYHLQIFNRWGELVFETRDPQKLWDGTYNNQPVQQGIYTIALRYGYKGAKTRNSDFYGNIHLIR